MANLFKLKRLAQSTIRMKVLPAFPARVVGGAGITVTKAGGTYTIAASGTVQGPGSSVSSSVARWLGTTGNVLTDSRVTISDGGTVEILTAANTNNRAINIVQTSPTSGSIAGPLDFNKIYIQNRGGVTSSGGDPFATQEARGLHIHMETGGASLVGFQNALRVRYDHTLADSTIGFGDHIGAVVIAYSNKNANGHGIYALEPLVWVASGGSHGHVVGVNPNVGLFTGASADYRTGIRLQTTGEVRADTSDTAISIVAGFADMGSSWQNAITLNEYGGAQSVAATGDFLKSNSAITLANLLNCSNFTISGNIIDIPHFKVTGAGLMTLHQGTVGTPAIPAGTMLHLAAAATAAEVTIDSYGAGGSNIVLRKSRGTSAGATATTSGDLLGGIAFAGHDDADYVGSRASIFAFASQTWAVGAHGAYIAISTTPNGSATKAEAVRIHGSAGVSIGHTNDPGAGTVHAVANVIANGFLATGGTGAGTGEVRIGGNSSGTVKLTAQAAAGTPTITFGNTSGVPAVVATSPLSIAAATGTISITTGTLSKVDDTNVTLTLGGTPTNALLSAVSITAGWTGVLAESRGGTGVSAAIYGTFYKSSNQAYTASSPAKVLIDTAETNQGLTFDGVTNNRVTIVTPGRYRVSCSVYMSGMTAGDLITGRIKKNGTTDLCISLVTASTSGAKEGSGATTKVVALTAGDYLEIYGSAPVNGTIHGLATLTFMSLEYIGA